MENTLLSLSIIYVIMWSMRLIITAVMRYLKSNTSTGSDQIFFTSRCSSSFGLNARRQPIVMQHYQTFKTFDIIDDFGDHHYRNTLGFRGYQPTHAWTKVISNEWKILEENLPDTIYVRVSESRMDLLRAVVIGPAGTPYHDGLFVFDVRFPPKYPAVPPEVHYHSKGLGINPNLYSCGRVCLSLLNTWAGRGNEKWLPNRSTVLQVLVSIQALVLNEKPFFNEPGYDSTYTGSEGARRSKMYNEKIFISSLKTMVYTLRSPPRHFEDFVSGHFLVRGRAILLACRAYMEGADIGCIVKDEIQGPRKVEKRNLTGFKRDIARLMNPLIVNFTMNGSEDCAEFHLTE
ncbi:putative ubiquitin-conjugating enzyme E2 38 [Daucus carota subsp. sativus]|uniref:putative ubiquitin-conjugating enzyme E2 38 n=1 Tax=Daucus carota subsp. sativus TaxID=79200 RepID=UPI0030827D6F